MKNRNNVKPRKRKKKRLKSLNKPFLSRDAISIARLCCRRVRPSVRHSVMIQYCIKTT